jgi:hypothetical protein
LASMFPGAAVAVPDVATVTLVSIAHGPEIEVAPAEAAKPAMPRAAKTTKAVDRKRDFQHFAFNPTLTAPEIIMSISPEFAGAPLRENLAPRSPRLQPGRERRVKALLQLPSPSRHALDLGAALRLARHQNW